MIEEYLDIWILLSYYNLTEQLKEEEAVLDALKPGEDLVALQHAFDNFGDEGEAETAEPEAPAPAGEEAKAEEPEAPPKGEADAPAEEEAKADD